MRFRRFTVEQARKEADLPSDVRLRRLIGRVRIVTARANGEAGSLGRDPEELERWDLSALYRDAANASLLEAVAGVDARAALGVFSAALRAFAECEAGNKRVFAPMLEASARALEDLLEGRRNAG